MGMSSSQARLLNLTARMHQIEYKAARLEAQKLQMANESSRVYSDYLNALEKTKLQYKAINPDGSVTFRDASLASLENGLIPLNSDETSLKSFFLRDVETNAFYISADYARSIGVTSDSEIFTGSLEAWLEQKGAPKTWVEVDDYDNPIIDTSKVNGISPNPNDKIRGYQPDSYDYSAAVGNTTEISNSNLVAGQTYTVSSAADLKKLADMLNNGQNTTGVTIKLANDIDMNSVSEFASINNFKGTFDGNGHKISNLSTMLFNTTNNATITNLEIVGANVTATQERAGILVGKATGGSISNIRVTSSTITNNQYGTGGLIGHADGVNISFCDVAATVNGIDTIGGLAGNISGGSVQHCYFGGQVNGVRSVGGFAGRIESDADVVHCESNSHVHVDADSVTGNPDSGGFVGTTANCKIEYCRATGAIVDDTTALEYKKTVIGGFMGCTSNDATNRTYIKDCDSEVSITTNYGIMPVGFASAFSGGHLELEKCNYKQSNIATTASSKYGFAYVDPTENSTLKITDCYTAVPDSSVTGCVNAVPGVNSPYHSRPFSHAEFVGRTLYLELSTEQISDDAISISSVGTNVPTVPSVTLNNNNGSLNRNITALLIKAGKISYDTAYSTENQNLIKNYLSLFQDNITDNSKLYYLNEQIVGYLEDSDSNTSFANKLWSDIQSQTTYTSTYMSGDDKPVIANIQRSTSNNAWTPVYTPAQNGEYCVPNIATLNSLIKAALKLDGTSVSDSQVDAFLAKYNTNNSEDKASLGYINEMIFNYNNGRGNLVDLSNAIISGTKLTGKPSDVDEISHYNFTMNSTDETYNVVSYGKTYPKKNIYTFDYESQITINLVNAYNAMQEGGFIIIGDGNDEGLDKSCEWLTNMIGTGRAILVEYDTVNNSVNGEQTSVSTETTLLEVADEKELKKAEAQYEADMLRIDMKDRRYDTQLAALDAERNAVKQEMETLKTVAKDNVDRAFKLFS